MVGRSTGSLGVTLSRRAAWFTIISTGMVAGAFGVLIAYWADGLVVALSVVAMACIGVVVFISRRLPAMSHVFTLAAVVASGAGFLIGSVGLGMVVK